METHRRPTVLLEALKAVVSAGTYGRSGAGPPSDLLDLFSRILCGSRPQSAPASSWSSIQERVETVFGPDLVDWSGLKGPQSSSSSSAKGSSSSILINRQKSDRRTVDSDAARGDDPLMNIPENSDVMSAALLVLYVASVHDQNDRVWSALTEALSPPKQAKVQKVFSFLLDNRKGDLVVTKGKLMSLLDSLSDEDYDDGGGGVRKISGPAAPSDSPATFSYSPKSPASEEQRSSPLGDYFRRRSAQLGQIAQHQKAAEECSRNLRQARQELDQEKADSLRLRQEVEGLQLERERLRKALIEARRASSNGTCSYFKAPQDSQEIEQLKRRNSLLVSDRKDTKGYVKKIEGELEEALERNIQLEARCRNLTAKMEDKRSRLARMEQQLVEYQASVRALEEVKAQLTDSVAELQSQLAELQRLLASGEIPHNRQFFSPQTPVHGFDISVDNPNFSNLTSDCGGTNGGSRASSAAESIADTVILDLKARIAAVEEELHEERQRLGSVSSSRAALEQELNNLKDLFNSLKSNYETALKTIEEGSLEIKVLQESVSQLTGANQESKQKIHVLTEESEGLQILTKTQGQKLQEFERKTRSQEEAISALKGDIEAVNQLYLCEKQEHSLKEAKVAELSHNLGDVRLQLAFSAERVSNLEEKLEGQSSFANDLTNRLGLKDQEISCLNDKCLESEKHSSELKAQFQANLESLRKRLQNTEKEKEELVNQIVTLKDNLKELSGEIGHHKAKSDELKDHVTYLNHDLKDAKLNAEALSSQLASSNDVISHLEEKLFAEKANIEALEKKLEAKEAEFASLSFQFQNSEKQFKDEQAMLESHLESEKQAGRILLKEKADLEQMSKQLQGTIESKSEEIRLRISRSEDLEKDLASMQKKMKNSDDLSAKLSSELDTHVNVIKSLQETVDSQRIELVNARSQIDTMATKIESLKTKHAETLESAKENSDAIAGDLRRDKERLQDELNEWKNANENLTKRMDDMMKDHESLLNRDNKRTAELTQEIMELRSQSESYARDVDKLTLSLETETIKFREERRAFKDGILDLETKLEVKGQEADNVRSELARSVEERKNLMEQSEAKIADLQHQHSSNLSEVNSKMCEEVELLKSHITALKSDISQKDLDVERMKSCLQETEEAMGKENETMGQAIVELKTQLAIFESELASAHKALSDMNSIANSEEARISELVHQNRVVSEQLEIKKEQSDALMESVTDLQQMLMEERDKRLSVNEKLQTEHEQATKILAEKQKQLEEIQQLLLSKEEEHCEAMKVLQAQAQSAEENESAKLAEVAEKFQTLQSALEAEKGQTLMLERQASLLEQELLEVQEKLDSAKNMRDEATKARKEQDEELKVLKCQVDHLREESDRLRTAAEKSALTTEETLLKLEEEVKAKTKAEGELEESKSVVESLKAETTDEKRGFSERLEKELKSQKARYEDRVKDIAEQIRSQYKAKIEESIKKWNVDIADKNGRIEELNKMVSLLETGKEESDGKYSKAKQKLAELVDRIKDRDDIAKKYCASKELIAKLQEEKKRLEAHQSHSSLLELKNDNEGLRRELNQTRNELRSLKVQNMAADAKIRELQADQHRRSSSASSLPSERRQTMATGGAGLSGPRSMSHMAPPGKDDAANFKMPSERSGAHAGPKNTPGRARTGRTQSEASMARRPPIGSGSLFMTDDEAGEMFSSSYLTDMKEGDCGGFMEGGRLSELSRRNTMVPAHMRSTYPAETQFFKPSEFEDADLQSGKLKDITKKTAELSFDSPAMNTRNRGRRSSVGVKPDAKVATSPGQDKENVMENIDSSKPSTKLILSPPRSLKRRSNLSAASYLNDTNDSEGSGVFNRGGNFGSKRFRRDQNLVSYSRPGPPTPARTKGAGNKSISSSNTSMDSTNRSLAAANNKSTLSSQTSMVVNETPANKGQGRQRVNDKTPLLDRTNASLRSGNRSKSSLFFRKNTPSSLRKVMSMAFKKNKEKYDVKSKLSNASLEGATKSLRATPVKNLKI